VPDPSLTLRQGAVRPWARSWRRVFWPRLEKLSKEQGVPLNVPWSKLTAEHRRLILEGGEGFRGAIPFLERLQKKSYDVGNRFIVKKYQTAMVCPECGGARLRREALLVRLGGRTIAEVNALTIARVAGFVRGLEFSVQE